MVGLSVVLETKSGGSTKLTQIINKSTNISVMANYYLPPPPPTLPLSSSSPSCPNYYSCFPLPPFLDHCFLCGKKLLPGTDIYMYKSCKEPDFWSILLTGGDRAFCSEECRYKQIFMDEDDQKKANNNCSLMAAATRPTHSFSTSASSSRASSSGSSRHKKGASRNRSGGFAY